MIKRALDIALAGVALIAVSPLLALLAIIVRLSSKGPILFRARLTGRNGRCFTMYKLRTMHVGQDSMSIITGARDPRVFRFGAWLRKVKLDELPQLLNILRGDMSIVGPRPEHPRIVALFYTPDDHALLRVRPGLTSPGTLYDYTHGEDIIGSADPERSYVERFLPIRLALDHVYLRRATVRYDAMLVGRTLTLIAASLIGRRSIAFPPEYLEASLLLARTQPPAGSIQSPAVV
jgi:lipopolysaccharide/colanic/teichoic acid biosynthesis glycosyltransferase